MSNQYDDDSDNSRSVRYEIERRRRRNLAMKKKRKRQILKRKIMLFVGAAAVLAASVSMSSAVRRKNTVSGSSMNAKETLQVSMEKAAGENKASVNIEDTAWKFEYASKSGNYVEITDEAVRTPYVALLDVDNNCIIAGRGSEENIYPASMTKIMTLIVAVENLDDMSRMYHFTNDLLYPLYLAQASVAGFSADEIVTVKDLLYGMVLPSGADAAVALAQLVAGSEEEFAVLMNEKCKELGLTHTHFTNATGLYDEQQYTTPSEMAMIMKYAMEDPVCANVLSTFQYTTEKTSQHPDGILLTSTMFSRMYGTEVEGVTITAGKTGYTDEARNCLVSYAVKGDRHYICVTAFASNKWHCVFDSFEIYGNYLP